MHKQTNVNKVRQLIRTQINSLFESEINTEKSIVNDLIERVPFFKSYKVYEDKPDFLHLFKIKYNNNLTFKGEEEYTVQASIVSEFKFNKHQIRDNVFYVFSLKNDILISKRPEYMDDLFFNIFIRVINNLSDSFSFFKEVMVKEGSNIGDSELNNIINNINKKMFEFETFLEKQDVDFF